MFLSPLTQKEKDTVWKMNELNNGLIYYNSRNNKQIFIYKNKIKYFEVLASIELFHRNVRKLTYLYIWV